MEKITWDGPKWGWEGLFLANPNLAEILCRTVLDFDNFNFLHVLDSKFLDFQVPRSPNSQISKSPDLQIPRSPNSQVPRFPDAAGAGAAGAAGRTLRSQPDPSPNAPRDQIRQGPLLRLSIFLWTWATDLS